MWLSMEHQALRKSSELFAWNRGRLLSTESSRSQACRSSCLHISLRAWMRGDVVMLPGRGHRLVVDLRETAVRAIRQLETTQVPEADSSAVAAKCPAGTGSPAATFSACAGRAIVHHGLGGSRTPASLVLCRTRKSPVRLMGAAVSRTGIPCRRTQVACRDGLSRRSR